MGVCCNSKKLVINANSNSKKHNNSISKEEILKIIEKMNQNACEIKKKIM